MSLGHTRLNSGSPLKSPTSRNRNFPWRITTPVERGLSYGSPAGTALVWHVALLLPAPGIGWASVVPALLTTLTSTSLNGRRSPALGSRCDFDPRTSI